MVQHMKMHQARQWWLTPLISALRRQRQSGLQSEFQDSQGYTEKPCLEKPKQQQQQQQQKPFTEYLNELNILKYQRQGLAE
jgi:hypothetical protein